MKAFVSCCARRRACRSLVALVFVFLWLTIGPATAVSGDSTPPAVVRVEEDWELVVKTPDPNSVAPQVTCAISPTSNTDSLHATFELNHQSQPDFVPGGLQLQVWNGESPVSSRKFPQSNIMSLADETVRWTQTMTLAGSTLTFEITGGSSTTWGAFGGQGYLKFSVPASLPHLNHYDPAVSVQNSGIGYAANRVQSLVLKKVRLVLSTGEVLEDAAPRAVHLQN